MLSRCIRRWIVFALLSSLLVVFIVSNESVAACCVQWELRKLCRRVTVMWLCDVLAGANSEWLRMASEQVRQLAADSPAAAAAALYPGEWARHCFGLRLLINSHTHTRFCLILPHQTTRYIILHCSASFFHSCTLRVMFYQQYVVLFVLELGIAIVSSVLFVIIVTFRLIHLGSWPRWLSRWFGVVTKRISPTAFE